MVLSEAGVGIALVNPEQEKEGGHVPGNSR
jgi:hypothetical protein